MGLSLELLTGIKKIVPAGSSIELLGRNDRKHFSSKSRYLVSIDPLEVDNRLDLRRNEVDEMSRIFIKYVNEGV